MFDAATAVGESETLSWRDTFPQESAPAERLTMTEAGSALDVADVKVWFDDEPISLPRVPVEKLSDLSRVIGDIGELRLLEYGWDSYGAFPVSRDSIEAALKIAASALVYSEQLPRVAALRSGGIALGWRRNGAEAELEVREQGCSLLLDGEPVREYEQISVIRAKSLLLDWLR